MVCTAALIPKHIDPEGIRDLVKMINKESEQRLLVLTIREKIFDDYMKVLNSLEKENKVSKVSISKF